MARNVVLCSTRLQHHDVHKGTWVSPDRSIRIQIDLVVIDERYASLVDVRTCRGPNIDHFLVAAKVRMRISTSRAVPSSTQRKLDVNKLRSQWMESYSAQFADNMAGRKHAQRLESYCSVSCPAKGKSHDRYQPTIWVYKVQFKSSSTFQNVRFLVAPSI